MVVRTGELRTVAYARTNSGEMPAKQFLDSNEKISTADRRALGVAFATMCDHGGIINRERFKKVEGEIWEFKKHQVRVLAFQEGTVWFLCHAVRKKTNKLPKREIDRAKRIRKQHLAWLKRRKEQDNNSGEHDERRLDEASERNARG